MLKKIIKILKNRYMVSGRKSNISYNIEKGNVKEINNLNKETFFRYLFLKGDLIEEEIKKALPKFLTEQISQEQTNNKNIKKTRVNHIIPCSYFAQWTKYDEQNKKQITVKKHKIKLTVEEKTLEQYMKVDFSLDQVLENIFVGQDENGKNISVNMELPKLRQDLERLEELNHLEYFELFYNKKNKERHTINMLFFYKRFNEENMTQNDFNIKGKINSIIKHMSIEDVSSAKLIDYINMFEGRQNLWEYINKDQRTGLVKIIKTILEDFNKNKNFLKYRRTLTVISKMFGVALSLLVVENTENELNDNLSYCEDKLKNQGEDFKNFFINKIIKEHNYDIKNIDDETLLKQCKALYDIHSNLMITEIKNIQKNILEKKLKKLKEFKDISFNININESEEIKLFLEKFLIAIENYEGEINNELSSSINSTFLVDLYATERDKEKSMYIFYSPKTLITANLPIFNSRILNLKMFAVSPHLLMLSGNKSILKCMKIVNYIGLGNLIIGSYQRQIKKRKDCDIIDYRNI